MKVKDHSVSKEEFELRWNDSLHCFETYPKPHPDHLPAYYSSEDYISHTDRKETLIERLYHLIRSYNIKWKESVINKHGMPKGAKLLDFGCGTGDFLNHMKFEGLEVFGVEPNDMAREIASSKLSENVFESLSSMDTFRFDCITMWHVLEHVYDPVEQSKELFSLLNKDGIAVIAVPNYKSWDADHYAAYWAAYDVPRHLWHFSKESVTSIFESNGFTLERIYPMKWDSFYVSVLSEKYKRSKFSFIKGILNGFFSNIYARRSGEYSSLTYVFRKTDFKAF